MTSSQTSSQQERKSPSEPPTDRRPSPFSAEPFRPSRWAPGPHLQTLVARVLRAPPEFRYTRERVTTPDGDFIDLDWGPEPRPEAPIVLVLHGLEGCSNRGYVRNVCAELAARGLRPAALNFRGCSGEPNRGDGFYHSGATGDPAHVLELVRARYPGRPIGAVGFSLGGNVLLKLMGERPDGGEGLLDAAVAMSVPYDLSAGCRLLEQSRMGRAYTEYFLRSLKRKIRMKEQRLAGRFDMSAVYGAGTLRRFDDVLTAPLHGFDSAEHYYGESSSAGYLASVRVQSLLIHAEDDPFLPRASIPSDEAAANPRLELRLEPVGGHVGFLQGTPWRPRFWADKLTADYLAARLGPATPVSPAAAP
ncbi:MAG: alpha/beta fold hydrolase [Gemmatimonadota bacterium]